MSICTVPHPTLPHIALTLPKAVHNYHSLSFASCGEISIDSATTFHPSTHHHHHLTVVPIAFLALRGNYSIRARISGLTERLDGSKQPAARWRDLIRTPEVDADGDADYLFFDDAKACPRLEPKAGVNWELGLGSHCRWREEGLERCQRG